MNQKTRKLTESAILIALGTVLALLTNYIPFLNLPYGGSITIFSMVPLVVISYRYGVKWGIFSGIVFGLLQMVIGITAGVFQGAEAYVAICSALLDYIVAYMVIGTAGMFRNKIKNPVLAIGTGTLVACLLRLVTHFISGAVFFGSYAEWFFTQEGIAGWGQGILDSFSGYGLAAIYSIVYNSMYMIPETVITVVGAVIVMSIAPLRAKITENI